MSEPWYECDPCYECDCTDIEPEWNWDEEQNCYICAGCGAIQ